VLNAQDLNMIEHLEELRQAGVDSFKIEGRNKRAFYVATVVGAYRSALDGGSVEAAARELLTISHRPYSTGFYYGRATQSPERDGYIKECVHVATVEDCAPASNQDATSKLIAGRSNTPGVIDREEGNGLWQVTAMCHNSFSRDDVLEAVRPGKVGQVVHVKQIRWLAPADGGKPFVERGAMTLAQVRAESIEQSVEVANRSKERYVFLCDVSLQPGDYIRKRL